MNKRLLCSSFFLFFFTAILFSEEPVLYTLTDDDVTVEAGIITACTYNFSENSGGTILTIPETLHDQTIVGITDGAEDFFFNITGPFVKKGLKGVQLPPTLEYLGTYAFRENNLDSITIPNSVTKIGRDAFLQNNLDSIFIPNSVKSIGASAFHSNTSLGKIVFESGSRLVNIGSHAFVNTDISTITLPSPVVPDDNFEYWLRMDGSGTTHNGGDAVNPHNHAFIAKFYYTLTDDDVEIENGIIQSCSYDFSCWFIIIPDELNGQTVIGIADASSQTNAIFYGKSLMELILPPNLETIGNFSLNSNSIKTIFIPGSVKSIGQYAFWGFSLDTVIFDEISNLSYLGTHAFANNSSLNMALPTPVKDGYIFENWKDGSNNIHSGGSQITNFNTSYTAQFALPPGTSLIQLTGELSFGGVAITNSDSKTLLIGNEGNISFTVSNIQLPDGFSANWISGEVEADAEHNVEITFEPSEIKIYEGYIKIISDAVIGMDSIFVSGSGIAEELQSIVELNDINVHSGTEIDEISFPINLDITTDGNTSSLDISGLTWLCPNYDAHAADSYIFTTDIADILVEANINSGTVPTEINVTVIVADGSGDNGGVTSQVLWQNNENRVKIKLYPNPVINDLFVEVSGVCRIHLLDISGKIILKKNVINSHFSIDMTNMARGLYLLKITDETGLYVKRIIKQ